MDPSELKELIIKSNKIHNQLKEVKSFIPEEVTRKFAFVSVVSDREIKRVKNFQKKSLVRRPEMGFLNKRS